jgi:hypothetical protein
LILGEIHGGAATESTLPTIQELITMTTTTTT